MKLHKIDVARSQLEWAIDQFLSSKDFIPALTLAGAAEDILGTLLQRKSKEKHVLQNLYEWHQENTGEKIAFGDFARKANFTRNTLKHANEESEDQIEVFRWEAVQMIMRALVNYRQLVGTPTEKMLVFNGWLQKNNGAYDKME